MLKTSLRLAWRGFNHITRIALIVSLLFALACAALMLGLRYWVLPDIEKYHHAITESLSQAIGQPISIGQIEADWRGIRPHLSLSDVRILDKDKPQQIALVLKHVDGVVSWRSVLWGQIRLYSLEIDHPDLLVRRDVHGLLHIAGVALSEQSSEDSSLADWLLHQTYIVVRDARITWLDEQRATPALVFNNTNLLIENGWLHHRFALRGLPPPMMSSRLDVRGDFTGRSFNQLSAWRGELYTRLDYADVAAWRNWLPLPAGFKSGKGALRSWLAVADGKVKRLTADLALANVRTQLAEDLPTMDLRTLSGRISWQDSSRGLEVSTHQLALRTDTVTLKPTDFYLRLAGVGDKQGAAGEVRANTLKLANLVSLTDFLPLNRGLKENLAKFAPQGSISNLEAKWHSESGKPMRYEAKARFDRLSIKRTDKFPGFSGLSGELNGSDTAGTLSLNTSKVTLDAPQLMPEALEFDRFSGQSSWRVNEQGIEVKFSNISATNSDLAGTMFGRFQTFPASPSLIDLNINLTRGAIHHADRYVPLAAMTTEMHDWLRSALLDGQADEFHLRLHSNLNEFPFTDKKPGIFQIKAHIQGAKIEYFKGWPQVNNVSAKLLIQGKRLEVITSSGATVGMNLQKTRVVVPDMSSPDMALQVHADLNGETANALAFIQQSPVRGYIDGFTDNISAHGKGQLQLSLDVPLSGSKPVIVSGEYKFANNQLNIGKAVPSLYSASGDLLFTESTMHTRNFTAKILGGPATLEVQSGKDKTLRAKLHGKADMDSLHQTNTSPLLARLHGSAIWDAEISAKKKRVNVLVTSNLSGLASSLPAPLLKGGDEVIPLRFELKSMAADRDVITVEYGKLFSARLLRSEENGNMLIKQGLLDFGSNSKWTDQQQGVWITGTLPELALSGWGGLSSSSEGDTSDAPDAKPFSIAGADLTIQKLDAYGHSVSDLHINARNQDGVLSAHLASKEMNGEVSWQPANKGKFVARLTNLALGEGQSNSDEPELTVWNQQLSEDSNETEFPALDLTVDNLSWKNKPLGKMELLAEQQGRDWQLKHLRITNPDGVLTADGKYHMENGKKQTEVKFTLDISNAGKILARSGYPDSVKNGSGKLEGAFAWRGAPDDFSYAKLDGKLKLNTGKGQFLKIEPGIGKLLGILSLQALPRHITLDFTDVFSNGFAFDNITGTAQINQGVMQTKDFRIDGSAAKVTMLGEVDLNLETQNLKVRILPTVGNSVSLLGAFAAGPLVGLGTFIVNKVLREPLDKLVSFEYNVTGTWINPEVVKTGQKKVNSPVEFNP